MNEFKKCGLCPRKCGVDRTAGEKGFCGASDTARIARSAPHMWEEPCISGKNGSGAIFFSHCTMKCAYCQNYDISAGGKGYDVSAAELAGEMLRLEALGVHNINLVTPSHYAPIVIRALENAKSRGMALPVVYNCGGYESVETIRSLKGFVDVYLPDIKYFSDKYAVKYSSAPEYFKTAAAAVREMFNQTGKNEFDKDGIMTRGVTVRHMLLPGLLLDSKKIIDYLYSEYGNDIYISLMSQYIPSGRAADFPEINRRIRRRAYDALVDYCAARGVENAFVQDPLSADSAYIPEFYGSGGNIDI